MTVVVVVVVASKDVVYVYSTVVHEREKYSYLSITGDNRS